MGFSCCRKKTNKQKNWRNTATRATCICEFTWSTTDEGRYDRQEKAQAGVDSNKNLIGRAAFPSCEVAEQSHDADDADGETQ